MFSYVFGGQIYYATGSKLYVPTGERVSWEEADERPPGEVYLYDYHDIEDEEPRECLVRLDVGPPGWPTRRVRVEAIHGDGKPERWIDVEDFSGARELETVVPNEINECPECGGWAGSADEDPRCLDCGLGYDDVEARTDGGVDLEDEPESGLLADYRTAPLSFPLHVLDEYGEALCGNLSEAQKRFLDREGYLGQPTIAEKRGTKPWKFFLGDICGNCRASLLARVEEEDIHAGWEERQEAIGHV